MNVNTQGLRVLTQGVSFSLGTKGLHEPVNVFQASAHLLCLHVIGQCESHEQAHPHRDRKYTPQ